MRLPLSNLTRLRWQLSWPVAGLLELGGEFQLIGLPERLLALAQVYGVTELLH